MRIKAFDCIACGGAFDVDPNGAKAPVYTEGSLKCRMCLPGPTYLWAGSFEKSAEVYDPTQYDATMIIDMLQKPNLRKTSDGWHAIGPLGPWTCRQCDEPYNEQLYKPSYAGICLHMMCLKCSALPDYKCCPIMDGCHAAQGDLYTLIIRYQRFVCHHNRVNGYAGDDSKEHFSRLEHGLFRCGYCSIDFPASEAVPMSCRMIGCPACRDIGRLPKKCTICPTDVQGHRKWFQKRIRETLQTSNLQTIKTEFPVYELEERQPGEFKEGVPKRNCKNCTRSCEISDMFSCTKCAGITICAGCCFRSHKDHDCVDLKEQELTKMEESTRVILTTNYEGLMKNIDGIHAEIVENHKALLTSNGEKLELVPSQADYRNGPKMCAELRAAAEDFEKCFEGYLPHARMYSTHLQKITEMIKKI